MADKAKDPKADVKITKPMESVDDKYPYTEKNMSDFYSNSILTDMALLNPTTKGQTR